MDGKAINELFEESPDLPECTEERVYEKDEILECYIMSVECLKLKLFLLEEQKTITFYLS